ncbi:MAG: AIR synthase-related protein, partial [Cyanobacteria bacterium P01_C01_bin.72]
VGGDICRSTVVSLAITALGEVLPPQAICRHTARPGDLIVATGCHGRSRGGLELLLNPELGGILTTKERESLIEAHQRPQPRLDVLPHLREIAPEIAIAGMDSSDGLADAVRQICRRSSVGAVLNRSQIAIDPGLIKLVGQEKAWSWVLNGGEDFELILCLPEAAAQQLVAKLGHDAAIIGKITPEPEITVVAPNSLAEKENIALEGGFQHFSN